MPEHEFTIIIDGDLTDEKTIDLLYNAGCDDASFGGSNGVSTADFAREAPTFIEAVISAITAVESVPGIRARRIEPDDLVTIPEIADRLGRTPESVRLLANGERGGGTFPPAVSHLTSRHRLWRWSDIAQWAGTITPSAAADAKAIAALNAMLELRHLAETDRALVEALTGRLGGAAA